MKVKDILKNKQRADEILGLVASASVLEAVKIMNEHDTGSIVVTDADGKLAGMLTFREVIKAICTDFSKFAETKVSELMDVDPGIATPEDTVEQLRALMTQRHLRYVPVMDKNRLVAVISFYDVARTLAKSATFENRMLRQYITDWQTEDN